MASKRLFTLGPKIMPHINPSKAKSQIVTRVIICNFSKMLFLFSYKGRSVGLVDKALGKRVN